VVCDELTLNSPGVSCSAFIRMVADYALWRKPPRLHSQYKQNIRNVHESANRINGKIPGATICQALSSYQTEMKTFVLAILPPFEDCLTSMILILGFCSIQALTSFSKSDTSTSFFFLFVIPNNLIFILSLLLTLSSCHPLFGKSGINPFSATGC